MRNLTYAELNALYDEKSDELEELREDLNNEYLDLKVLERIKASYSLFEDEMNERNECLSRISDIEIEMDALEDVMKNIISLMDELEEQGLS